MLDEQRRSIEVTLEAQTKEITDLVDTNIKNFRFEVNHQLQKMADGLVKFFTNAKPIIDNITVKLTKIEKVVNTVWENQGIVSKNDVLLYDNIMKEIKQQADLIKTKIAANDKDINSYLVPFQQTLEKLDVILKDLRINQGVINDNIKNTYNSLFDCMTKDMVTLVTAFKEAAKNFVISQGPVAIPQDPKSAESAKTIPEHFKELDDHLLTTKKAIDYHMGHLNRKLKTKVEDLKYIIVEEAQKGEKVQIKAGADRAVWLANVVREVLDQPPLCFGKSDESTNAGLFFPGNQEPVGYILPEDQEELNQNVIQYPIITEEIDQMPVDATDPVALQKSAAAAAVEKANKEYRDEKRKRREELSKRPDYEQWSPTSRNIILTTWEIYLKQKHNRDMWYSPVEFEKYERIQKRRAKFWDDQKKGLLPAGAVEPSKYHPKPFAYFSRQDEKAKEAAKGKKIATEEKKDPEPPSKKPKGIVFKEPKI